MKATIWTILDASPDRVWEAVKRVDTLLYVTRGIIGFPDLVGVTGEWQVGSTVSTRMRLFHILPGWMHHLAIVEADDDRREIYSNEKGGMVKIWNHLVQVESLPNGRSRYTDQIEIDAGILTVFVWLFAHVFYRYRQRRWRKLVQAF